MRTERELKAAAIRALFAELWASGVTSTPELAIRLEQSRRNIERLVAEWKTGKMAEKIARDRALLAHETGEAAGGSEAGSVAPAGPVVRDLPPDPGTNLDHMSIARRAAVDPASKLRDRLKAVETLERGRQFNLTNGINAGAKNLRLEDWLEIKLEDVPKEARARLFGLLAEEMAQARTPWMGSTETTSGQVEVYGLLGLQVPADEAEALLQVLAPARAAALALAAELAAARKGPPPDADPVVAEGYLQHVPGATDD